MRTDFVIRALENIEEYSASQQIMAATWGSATDDIEPTHMLIAAAHAGGLVAGAFEEDRLIGFSFAFPGRVAGRSFLYSHMTAVLPDRRGHQVGTSLKWYQRAWCLEHGLDLVRWTFDPLMAPNARFNLHRLGATAVAYHVDFYGRSSSPLHGILPTDRFVVDWELNDPGVRALAEGRRGEAFTPDAAGIPLLYPVGDGRPLLPDPWCAPDPEGAPVLAAEVPGGFLEMQKTDPERARAWRLETRRAFSASLEAGYRFVDFMRMPAKEATPPSEAYLLVASSSSSAGGEVR